MIEAARELRDLVSYLSKINTHEEAMLWMRAFVDWYYIHEKYINEKSIDEQTGRWWSHKFLHRSVTHIKRALPYLFNYGTIPDTRIYQKHQTLLSPFWDI